MFWGGYLVEVENQIKLTDIAEEMVQNLNEQVDAFKVSQLIVCYVNAQGEKQPSISPVYNLMRSKLPKKKKNYAKCHLYMKTDKKKK